jgi:hypothetical protein
VTATVRGSTADVGGVARGAIAVRIDPLAGTTVVAIAGAPGAIRAARSDIGARIAADVGATKAEAAVASLRSTDAGALAPSAGVLAERIVEQWRAQVDDHRRAQSPGDQRTGGAEDGTSGVEEVDPLRAYGTALLVVVVTPAAVLAMQLGAGDIVLRTDDGDTVRPVPGDRADGGSAVESLALADAGHGFRHAVVDRTTRDVALVLAATGLDDATTDRDPGTTLADELAAEADEHGIDSIEGSLEQRLAGYARADGDDIAASLVFPAAAVAAPAVVAAPDATDPRLAVTTAVAAVGAGGATPALATSTLPAVTTTSATARASRRRRRWIAAAVAAGVVALAIAGVLALSHDNGSSTPATVTSTTPRQTTSTTAPASTSTSPPSTAGPTTAPTTAPPPTTVPVVVTSPPTTAAPPRTTTTRPPAPTTTPPPTTVPVTPPSPPTT